MEDLPPTLTLFSPFIAASPDDSLRPPSSHFQKRTSLSLLQNISILVLRFITEFSSVLN